MKRSGTVFFLAICSVLVFYLLNRYAFCFSRQPGDILTKAVSTNGVLASSLAEDPFFLSLEKDHFLVGLSGAAAVWLIYAYNAFTRKHFRRGEEHGSARWGTPADIRPLMNDVPELNIPLSATEQISLPTLENFEADRNKNIVVVGGSGSGKTYGLIKPSLMQLHSSYVITDPKGTILPGTGHMLADAGYEIRVLNTVDFSKSLHYNPLAYIHKEADILRVVNVLIENTKGDARSGDKFWEDAERLLYTALIAYLFTTAEEEDRTLPMMIRMLELMKIKEDDDDYQSPIDILFEDLAKEDPECLAVKQYRKFKQAAGKTMKSILISCSARLAPFDIAELSEILTNDELELDLIGDRKTAFFIIMSDTESTYSFLIAMVLYQMFNLLCTRADNDFVEQGGHLPIPVRCLFDEFANCGRIPEFHRLISTIRSRNISCMIVLQSLTQLKANYKDFAEIIVDNCDSFVFLGGKSTQTTEQIAKMIGKQTIDTQNTNENRGEHGGFSLQNNTLGRDLLDPAEIGKISRSECIVLITGLPPFRSKKYPTQKHKRFKEISDGGSPLFDIRSYQPRDDLFLESLKSVYTLDLTEINDLE